MRADAPKSELFQGDQSATQRAPEWAPLEISASGGSAGAAPRRRRARPGPGARVGTWREGAADIGGTDAWWAHGYAGGPVAGGYWRRSRLARAGASVEAGGHLGQGLGRRELTQGEHGHQQPADIGHRQCRPTGIFPFRHPRRRAGPPPLPFELRHEPASQPIKASWCPGQVALRAQFGPAGFAFRVLDGTFHKVATTTQTGQLGQGGVGRQIAQGAGNRSVSVPSQDQQFGGQGPFADRPDHQRGKFRFQVAAFRR